MDIRKIGGDSPLYPDKLLQQQSPPLLLPDQVLTPSKLAGYIQGPFSDWLDTNKGLLGDQKYVELQNNMQEFAASLLAKSSFTGEELGMMQSLFASIGAPMSQGQSLLCMQQIASNIDATVHGKMDNVQQQPMIDSAKLEPYAQNVYSATDNLIASVADADSAPSTLATNFDEVAKAAQAFNQKLDSMLYSVATKMQQVDAAVAAEKIQDSSAAPSSALQAMYSAMVWLKDIFSYFSSSGQLINLPQVLVIFPEAVNSFELAAKGITLDPSCQAMQDLLNTSCGGEGTLVSICNNVPRALPLSSSQWSAIASANIPPPASPASANPFCPKGGPLFSAIYNATLGPNNWFKKEGINPDSNNCFSLANNSLISSYLPPIITAMQALYADLNTMNQDYNTWNISQTSANLQTLGAAAEKVASDITALLPLIAGPQQPGGWTAPNAAITSNGNIEFLDTLLTSEQTPGVISSSIYMQARSFSASGLTMPNPFIDAFCGSSATAGAYLVGSGGVLANILDVELNAPVSPSS